MFVLKNDIGGSGTEKIALSASSDYSSSGCLEHPQDRQWTRMTGIELRSVRHRCLRASALLLRRFRGRGWTVGRPIIGVS